jgi:hypothetical protein
LVHLDALITHPFSSLLLTIHRHLNLSSWLMIYSPHPLTPHPILLPFTPSNLPPLSPSPHSLRYWPSLRRIVSYIVCIELVSNRKREACIVFLFFTYWRMYSTEQVGGPLL